MTVQLVPIPPIPDSGMWVTVDEADAYFSTRIGASRVWCSGAEKTAALTTAQNQILSLQGYEFPLSLDDPSVYDPTDDMKKAVCEQALYCLLHQADSDRRLGMQAQGVTGASAIQESWSKTVGIPISAFALMKLRPFLQRFNQFDVVR